MKKLLSLALALGLTGPALAQNYVPQVGTISAIQKNFTYSGSAIGLVPASAATDVFCINASSTVTIAIRRIVLSGTAGTAITTPVLVYRRATLDTGGTPATGLALPVAAALGSVDPASTSTLVSYTANPTVTDASPGLVASAAVSFAVTTTANTPTVLSFGSAVDVFSKGIDLRKGSTQQICLNLNGATITSGVLNFSMQWQEVP